MADQVFKAASDIDVGDVVMVERVVHRRRWQFWKPKTTIIVQPWKVISSWSFDVPPEVERLNVTVRT